MDHHAIPLMRRDRRGQRGVVVDLELVSRRVGHQQMLVTADLGRLRQHTAVEGHFSARASLDYVLVNRAVVRRRPRARRVAGRQEEQEAKREPEQP